MAASPQLSLLLPVLVVFSSLFSSPCSALPGDYDKVCRKTGLYQICLDALSLDPRTEAADVPLLAEIAIDLARKNVTNTEGTILALYLNVFEDSMRGDLRICYNTYMAANLNLQEAMRFLYTKSYQYVSQKMETIRSVVDTCSERFGSPPALASPLHYENINLKNLSELISRITNQIA